MTKLKTFVASTKARYLAACLAVFASFAMPALASAQTAPTTTVSTPDLVTGGTTGLSSGVSVLVAFLYSALPILLALAVAAGIVRWVVSRISRGAH